MYCGSTLSFFFNNRTFGVGGRDKTLFSMKFEDLNQFIAQCEYKVGDILKGATIDEIVPVPSNYVEEFLNIYKECQSAEHALTILCARNNCNITSLDYGVIAVCNKNYIQNQGVLFYHIITDVD